MESEKTQKSQYNSAEEQRVLPLLDFKTSNDYDGVIFDKGMSNTLMEQNEPRSRSTQIYSSQCWQMSKGNSMGKR